MKRNNKGGEAMAVPKMIGLKEAAAVSGLSYNFLRQLCIEGVIYCIRAGSKWFINSDSLAAFLGGEGGED